MTEQQVKGLLRAVAVIEVCLVMIVSAGIGVGVGAVIWPDEQEQQQHPSTKRPSTTRV